MNPNTAPRTLTRAEYQALRHGYRLARRRDTLALNDCYRNRRQPINPDFAFSYFKRHPIALAETFLRRGNERPVAGDRCRIALSRLWSRRSRAEFEARKADIISAVSRRNRELDAQIARERAA